MFTIHTPEFHAKTGTVRFCFSCETYGAFEESVVLGGIHQYVSQDSFEGLLNLAAVILGVSYYKLAAHRKVVIEPGVSYHGKDLIEAIYTKGLGEFYVRNQLAYPPNTEFEYKSPDYLVYKQKLDVSQKALVAFGGGKDSHVVAHILHEKDTAFDLISVVLSEKVRKKLQEFSVLPLRFIERRLDTRLLEFARQGKGYNGHIPITAINSVLLMLYAVLHGYNSVIFSNEKGASVPTLRHNGHDVNHQYSKSAEFETLFRKATGELISGVAYSSILRHKSELWIAKTLAQKVKETHAVFASCNRNFIFDGPHRLKDGQRWCGECSKCVYTAIILAPHLSPTELNAIFKTDILNNQDNIKVARDLCGIGTAKPWECVGDFFDTASALYQLTQRKDWGGALVLQSLQADLEAQYGTQSLLNRYRQEV